MPKLLFFSFVFTFKSRVGGTHWLVSTALSQTIPLISNTFSELSGKPSRVPVGFWVHIWDR